MLEKCKNIIKFTVMKEIVKKRFQECNKIEKLWRYRWYLCIPFMFIYHWFVSLKVYEDKEVDGRWEHTSDYFKATPKLIWSICIGTAQSKMRWYHTSEEVLDYFKNNK